ncbi:MAG: squalene synthase HpnC [Phycisphaeraceae bacterium]
MPSSLLDQLDTYGPDRCKRLNYEQAVAYTKQLAKTHYENFTVVSWFLPKRLRDDFRHVYSFCRWADDLGDETGDPKRSLELLAWWRHELDLCYEGTPRHPVFVALWPTIQEHDIPSKPFDKLIDAFVQDQTVTRYNTWDQVLDYCTRSADPVGRLVLYLCGYRDEARQRLSDATCTALQLANFWQDVRRDVLERDRVYLPSDVASRHGLDLATMAQAIKFDVKPGEKATCAACEKVPTAAIHAILPAYRATIKDLCDRTWPLFEKGRALWPLVARDVRLDIQLFGLGGEAILKLIRKQDYDTLRKRPRLGKAAKLGLMMRALFGKLFGIGVPRGEAKTPDPLPEGDSPSNVTNVSAVFSGDTMNLSDPSFDSSESPGTEGPEKV